MQTVRYILPCAGRLRAASANMLSAAGNPSEFAMSADILLADFKSRNYTKLKPEDLLPIIELTPLQVDALSIVGDIMSNLQEVPDNYDPRCKP